MKAWKFIAVLSVLITGLSLYQLSFTLKSNAIDKEALRVATQKAETLAKTNPSIDKDSVIMAEKKLYIENKWDEKVYLGFSLKETKRIAINLGLDLQGGTHATVIVSPDDILTRMSNNNTDPKFKESVLAAKARMQTDQAKFTELFYSEWKKRANGRKLNEIFLSASSSEITLQTSDDKILAMINDELDQALDRSVIVLRSRIDEFGATNPIIQPVKSTGRIEIELPGYDNEELIRTQVEKVAHLEFVEPYDMDQFKGVYAGLKAYYDTQEKAKKGKVESDVVEEVAAADSLALLDTAKASTDSTLALKDTTKKDAKTKDEADAKLTTFDKLFMDGGGAIMVSNNNLVKVKRILASDEFKSLLPSDLTMMFEKESRPSDKYGMVTVLYAMKKGVDAPALMDGSRIDNAYVTRGENGALAAGIHFDTDGTTEWAAITEKYKKKPIAIVLDNEVYSMPIIQEVMNTGNCVVSGSFTFEEANLLVNILKAGKLPAPTQIERLVKVGPSMGAEAIQQGLFSLIAGLLLVVGFMIAYYNKAGLISILALAFNLLFIFGILATPSYGVTLTMAGIAGIALTIGMAVDANVLIFERIREEIREGKSNAMAIEVGYSRAFWTIFDSNITTFITAFVLYLFGTGLVKGFAVALMIGVVCSFFTAVYISRLVIFLMGRKNEYKSMKFSTPISDSLFKGGQIDFLSKRKFAYLGSALIILAGFGLIAKDGLNLGVAFKGGYSYVYSFEKAVLPTEARAAIKEIVKEADVQIKAYDKDNQLNIMTSYMIDSPDPDAAKKVQDAIEKGLSKFGAVKQLQSIEVGATIADDIRDSSIQSIIISLIAIFLYILLRFSNWRYGFGAIVALFHDVLFVIASFAIARVCGFSFEIDEVFVAAILTLIGFSINDTVVVFDFIREQIGEKKASLGEAINLSLNNSLSRTLMTSLTVLFVVLMLFIFGGESLRGFSFALLIGIVTGTYSSIFIASPLMYDTTNKNNRDLTKQ